MAPWTVLYQIGLKSCSHRPSYPGRAPIPEPPEPQSVPPPRPCRLAQKSCSGCSFRAPSLCWHTNDPRWIETNSRNAPAAPTMESIPYRTLSSHMGVRVCACAPSCEDRQAWKICAESVQTVTGREHFCEQTPQLRNKTKKCLQPDFLCVLKVPELKRWINWLLCYISGNRKLSVERGTLQRPWDAWMLCSIRFIQGMHLIIIIIIIITIINIIVVVVVIIISCDSIKCAIWVIGDYDDWQTVFMLLVIAPQS